MNSMNTDQDSEELDRIARICQTALESTIADFADYSGLALGKKERDALLPEFALLKTAYDSALLRARDLANNNSGQVVPERLSSSNPRLKTMLTQVRANFPQAANIWVLHGLLFQSQRAGIKTLMGCPRGQGDLLDGLTSASSIALGAENPWLIQADRIEDLLGIRDNICSAYHPGVRQGFVLQELSKQYPGNLPLDKIAVHMETSGTIAATVAIESAIAYVEARDDKPTKTRILAVDGTWAGGYGTAREATGYGVDTHQAARNNNRSWVDRCLPPPTRANMDNFLQVLGQKLSEGTVAGIYLEPDIIGDLGVIKVDPQALKKARELLGKHRLPIILDCVQQLGRTGSYWGENVDAVFREYPYLLILTAKSAANGQPFGYTLMPKEIADAAQPLTQITTNQMNGPLLRAVVANRIMGDPELQQWIRQKTKDLEEEAAKNGIPVRGKFLNRGFELKDNDSAKRLQLALLLEDGILVGALPSAVRYQPQLFELSSTNRAVARLITHRIKEHEAGNIAAGVETAYKTISSTHSGLARENIQTT
jgi:acetylornithine/succinyldiaminopimelate/putrescine aminotransferase